MSSTTISSCESNNRIHLIDSLRGYAMLGLFMVHMIEYFELFWLQPEENIYKDIVFTLFAGKSYALFAFLFGVSFFIVSDNSVQQGNSYYKPMLRRFIILLFLGLLHSFFYSGDILQILAIAGLLLLPMHRLPSIILLIYAVIFLLQIPAIFFLMNHTTGYEQPMHWSMYGKVFEAYANGSFWDVVKMNMFNGNQAKWTFMFESGRLSTIAGLTALGYWMGKTGFFSRQEKFFRTYLIGFFVSFILGVVLIWQSESLNSWCQEKNFWMYGAIYNNLKDLVFVFLTLFSFILLFQFRYVQQVLLLLAPCGRMTLSLYIVQSLLLVPFFYHYGASAYSWIGQRGTFYLGLVLWVFFTLCSTWWFKQFRYGPFEWLWRSLVLGERVAFQKEEKKLKAVS